jgi:hypothetical protein
MSLTGQNITEKDIERYIFAEMDPDEREVFDEKAFLDDEIFFETADLENRLVDSYVAGKLTGEMLTRFEQSLEAVPSRREKIANARSLNRYIGEERPVSATAEQPSERASVWTQFASLLGGRALGFGMAAALVLLAVATGLLFVQNQRKAEDLARLKDTEQKQGELQSQLEQSRQHESELRSSIDAERDASGDLQEELDRERTRREQIERELNKLRNTNVTQPGPVIASVVLSPFGGRGLEGGEMGTVRIGPETKRVSIRLNLSTEVEAVDRLTVKLNQKPIAADVAPRISGRNRSVNVSVPAVNLNKGRNDIDVTDTRGTAVGNYRLNVVEIKK